MGSSTTHRGWIGVDLDGTLAHYDGWKGFEHIGPPVERMRQRVIEWLSEGRDVRIFTARVCGTDGRNVDTVRGHIEAWCLEHLGRVLPVTNKKDYAMAELWDDRAIQVRENTGLRVDGRP